MAQTTNFNTFPYYDDFDPNSDFYKILFKPGYPVQARELTSLQSILSNQIEQFGNHIFKEGSAVIPGVLSVNSGIRGVVFEETFAGLNVSEYLPSLLGITIVGKESGVRAKIFDIDKQIPNLAYVTYSGVSNLDNVFFLDEENLYIETEVSITSNNITSFKPGQEVGTVQSTTIGTGVVLSEGVFFIRGNFVKVPYQSHIIDPFTPLVNARIGLLVKETIVNAEDDPSLYDNSRGFENFAAPGADRFKIETTLTSFPLDVDTSENFVELMRVQNGKEVSNKITNTQYNILSEEFARRTYDESGNYYIIPFTVQVKESLNDIKGNDGLFTSSEVTPSNNFPRESLGIYKISPGKAYVRGYEVDVPSSVLLDFEKPRTSKTLSNQAINYFTGSTFTVNKVSGLPVVGFSTNYVVSLRDERVGSNPTVSSGEEIGIARVYDIALESGSYDSNFLDSNQWDISLYDLQLYTELTLNENLTSLQTPCFVKGKASGSTGFLNSTISNSNSIKLYTTNGRFLIGEELLFNGVDANRIITSIKKHDIENVKSLYSNQDGVFSSDVVQYQKANVGQVLISQKDISSGISTVTKTDYNFSELFKEKSLVTFSVDGSTLKNIAKVTQVDRDYLEIVGLTTVSGVYEGSLYNSEKSALDFSLVNSKLQSSTDNTFYTPLPKKLISSVDLSTSSMIVRRVFTVNIANNSVIIAPQEVDQDEVFLPFDEERYILFRTDGSFEILTSDKFTISSGGKELTINGLGSNDTGATLVATMRRNNIGSKTKVRNKVKTIVVDKSKYSESGIGATTKNDGLTFGNYPYGTRVQDEEICLLYPDVTKIHAIYESNSVNDPVLPSVSILNIESLNSSAFDTLIGETVECSNGSVAMVIEHKNANEIYIKYLNSNRISPGEILFFKDSIITATVSSVLDGDNDITSKFTLDQSQGKTFSNYSKIIRNSNYSEPSRKLKICFEYSSVSPSDSGDIVTVDSYYQYDYCDLPTVDGFSVSDIIDNRPRVSPYIVAENARSPFEFYGRSFVSSENDNLKILVPDESITVDYSFYLPRIDRIFLTSDKQIILKTGVSEENPEKPEEMPDGLEIATIYLPGYLCNVGEAKISLIKHKRYQMKDISMLEDRIKNLEYYSSLSTLESTTSNLQIKDAQGLERFKSGFFVDNFTTSSSQYKKTTPKNSIDVENNELRPSSYTTSIDLLLGTNSLLQNNQNIQDLKFATDLVGENVRRSVLDPFSSQVSDNMGILTLDYREELWIEQKFATRVESVTPYMIQFYDGSITLNPSSDIWVDQVRLETNTIQGFIDGYSETDVQLSSREADPSLGWSPVLWNAWENSWTGSTSTDNVTSETTRTIIPGGPNQTNGSETVVRSTTLRTTTRTGTANRSGSSSQVRYTQGNTYNLGDRILSVNVSPFMRSRNIEFIGRRLRPNTRIFASFDKKNVTGFVVPKLLRVEILSGSFQVGETVVGGELNSLVSNSPYIRFRVAQLNHRSGPFNSPTDVFLQNPYTRTTLPSTYSSTETIVNVDTSSLGIQSETGFYGFVQPGMIIVGQTSGCRARISTSALEIFTDETGTIIGSFFIPNPNSNSSFRFNTGNVDFELTDSPTFRSLTKASATFFSSGSVTPTQSTVISTRNVEKVSARVSDVRSISETTSLIVGTETTRFVENPQPVPIPAPLPVPAVFYNPVSYFPSPVPFAPPFDGNPPRWIPPAPVFTILPPFPLAGPPVAAPPITTPRIAPIFIPRPPTRPPTRPPRRPPTRPPVAPPFIVYPPTAPRRPPPPPRTPTPRVYPPRATPRGSEYRPPNPAWVDPIAQSFNVPANGCFVTSVDLFFQSKDPDPNESVWVELRPMKLGLPESETRYPMSTKTLYSRDILVSDDASIPTRVNFEAPIYVDGSSVEHCIVIGSRSTEFTVWISRLGEVDASLRSSAESLQTPITNHTFLGSFFKSQNARTWTPSQYDDLKFNLYIAKFAPEGSISFFNPNISDVTLKSNSLFVQSNRISVGLGTTVSKLNSNFTISPGNTVFQEGSNATGNYVGGAGISTGLLGIVNSGIGYTPFSGSLTYNNVPLSSVTGNGQNATANITITNGVAVAATISNGGNGYVIGDILTADNIGDDNLGRNLSLSVSNIYAINQIILDQVQGDFVVGSGKTIKYITSSGITTTFSDNSDVFIESPPKIVTDGLHIKVNHLNHGMHSLVNKVSINNVSSDVTPSILQTDFDSESTITISDTTEYENFENYPVSESNPGYVLIDSEIISYTSASGGELSGIVRGIDSTITLPHISGSKVYKYELNGISLRRINKEHTLQDVTINPVEGKIGLDHYYIKIDTSSNGIDRSSDSGNIPSLKFNETKSTGGDTISCSRNIQYEIMRPTIQTLVLPPTSITAEVRTISSTSINGTEVSFVDGGFSNITLDKNNYFDTPRLIASRPNETSLLQNLPANKSLEIKLNLKTEDAYVSPVVDLDRTGLILISNRVNSPIIDYINDPRISTVTEDPTAFSYITKPIELEIPATSLRVIVSAYVNNNSDIRAFFSTTNDETVLDNLIYYPFPGYSNRLQSGELIDINNNDGTSDKKVEKVDNYGFGSNDLVFKDYEFTIDNLSNFKYFSIKLIGTSSNQSYPPRFRDFRVIAFA